MCLMRHFVSYTVPTVCMGKRSQHKRASAFCECCSQQHGPAFTH